MRLIYAEEAVRPPNLFESRAGSPRLRVVTYNVHKCRGLDGRVRPHRIASVLNELDADVIALQEVTASAGEGSGAGHAEFLAETLGLNCCFGENRRHGVAPYGNAILTRLPIHHWQNYDITAANREPRGCLRADVSLPGSATLRIFNLHMGTGFFERRTQVHKFHEAILPEGGAGGVRLILGDFNEWTRGLASRLLSSRFNSADPRVHLGRRHTYPGLAPFLHLDHIYFDSALKLEKLSLYRSPLALLASDHLPLMAEFGLRQLEQSPSSRRVPDQG